MQLSSTPSGAVYLQRNLFNTTEHGETTTLRYDWGDTRFD